MILNSFLDQITKSLVSLPVDRIPAPSLPLRWIYFTNGDVDFIDNVILFGFESNKLEPTFVAKVPRLAENGEMLQVEYDSLVYLWELLGKDAIHLLPKPILLTTLLEQPVLVITYLMGESLARISREGFWNKKEKVQSLAVEAAKSLLALNKRTSQPLTPSEQLPANFKFQTKADKFREIFSLSKSEETGLSELERIYRNAELKASHKVLVQGDFWHGNMIRGTTKGSLMLIDWQFAHWAVDVSIDYCLFLLAGAIAAAPYGPAEKRAQGARKILSQWQTNIIPVYMDTYGQPDDYILLPLRYGMLACCVEKAVRSLLDFGFSHPDDMMWQYLFSELLDWPYENE